LFTSELTLLAKLKQAKTSEVQNQKKAIMDLLGGDVKLRSKRELIEKFIEENLPHIDDVDKLQDEFEQYWQDQQVLALARLCGEEQRRELFFLR
jgi:type I restriction enzyme R subunit